MYCTSQDVYGVDPADISEEEIPKHNCSFTDCPSLKKKRKLYIGLKPEDFTQDTPLTKSKTFLTWSFRKGRQQERLL